jgi:putative heme-binding domain-containing protein
LLRLVGLESHEKEARTDGLIGRLALLGGLGSGLERSGPPLHVWFAQAATRLKIDVQHIASLWPAARVLALSSEASEPRRIGFEALVRGEPRLARSIIPQLLLPSQPAELRSAAAKAVGSIGSTELATQVIDSWNDLSLGTRRELLSVLVSRLTLAGVVVAAIDQEKIAAVELDPANRDALLHLPDPTLRKRALAILARSEQGDRSNVVGRYQAAVKLTGDAGRGAVLFAKNCQSCHQYQGQGHRVGPDLSGIAGRPPSVLVSDILDPNRDVAPDFIALAVATTNGQVISGLLAEETGSSLKLRKAEGIEETLLRSQISEIRSTGRSLMPEGMEQTLNLQEMADLLRFLGAPRAVSP